MHDVDETEKKELLYKSTHRGCKETDILLGNFATSCIDSLTDSELLQYKKIIDMDDEAIYSCFQTGSAPKDLELVFKKILDFTHSDKFTI